MLQDISKELSAHGINLLEGGKVSCSFSKEPISIKEANKKYVERSLKNRKFILELWKDLIESLSQKNENKSETYPYITRIFIDAVQSLYDLAINFSYLKEQKIVDALSMALDSDSSSYSSTTMNKVIDLRLCIEWVNHKINNDIYIANLLSAYYILGKESKQVIAYGVDGFYSRLDVPMGERVFSFDEIEEDLRGRSRDIKNQRRYRAGLEGYNYPYVNEGYYWREIRNEPYSFDDEDNNPYPHRDSLWR